MTCIHISASTAIPLPSSICCFFPYGRLGWDDRYLVPGLPLVGTAKASYLLFLMSLDLAAEFIVTEASSQSSRNHFVKSPQGLGEGEAGHFGHFNLESILTVSQAALVSVKAALENGLSAYPLSSPTLSPRHSFICYWPPNWSPLTTQDPLRSILNHKPEQGTLLQWHSIAFIGNPAS